MRLAFFPNLSISVSCRSDTMQIYMHNLFKCIEDRKLCCICFTCVLLDKWYTQLLPSINLPAARVNDGKGKKGVKTTAWFEQGKWKKRKNSTGSTLALVEGRKLMCIECLLCCQALLSPVLFSDRHRSFLRWSIIYSFLQMRLREVKYLPQVHTLG